MIQFDEHIFQMGWNHQLVNHFKCFFFQNWMFLRISWYIYIYVKQNRSKWEDFNYQTSPGACRISEPSTVPTIFIQEPTARTEALTRLPTRRMRRKMDGKWEGDGNVIIVQLFNFSKFWGLIWFPMLPIGMVENWKKIFFVSSNFPSAKSIFSWRSCKNELIGNTNSFTVRGATLVLYQMLERKTVEPLPPKKN